MRTQRSIALLLLIILGLFVVTLLAGLVHLQLQESLLDSTRLDAMKKDLESNPRDETLKAEIRALDLAMRQSYFQNRQQFHLAAYLALFGVVGWILTAKWYFSLQPVTPPLLRDLEASRRGLEDEISRLREEAEELSDAILARQKKLDRLVREMQAGRKASGRLPAAIWAVGGVFLAAVVTLLLFGLHSAPSLPGKAEDTPEPVAAPAESVEQYEANWPCFRGPYNIGVAPAATNPPTTFSLPRERNILWKTPISLAGKSSPVIWEDAIYLTAGTAAEHHVLCIDRTTGQILWDKVATIPGLVGADVQVMPDTGFAAPTPVTDGERVYALYPTGALVAFDREGNQLWSKALGIPESLYGFAASLQYWKGVVIVQYDQGTVPGEKTSYLYGFDGPTGNTVYRVERPVHNSWSSPALIPAGSPPTLVTTGPGKVLAYNPLSGKENWSIEWEEADMAPCPAWGGGLIFVTNDLVNLMAIRPGGSGDVTETHVAWTAHDGMPDTSSPVTDGQYLLQCAAGGFITCFDVETGELLYEHFIESNASASPILAGGRVYLAGEDGRVRVIELADEWKLIDKGEVGEPIYATPAFLEDQIYIRSSGHLICVAPMEAP